MNPLSGVLDEAWRMYKTFAKHLLAIAFVIYLIAAVITALLALAGGIISILLAAFVSVVATYLLTGDAGQGCTGRAGWSR